MKVQNLLYQQIADEIEYQINHGMLKVGSRLPSLRTMAMNKDVSINTVIEAYLSLERKGIISSKHKSGYFVSNIKVHQFNNTITSHPRPIASFSDISDVFSVVFSNSLNNKKNSNLASTQLATEFLPLAQLRKSIIYASRNLKDAGIWYDKSGNENLKKQIALRSHLWGGKLLPKNIIPTQGCFDAIQLCMTALLKPGDTIAVESPVHFGVINLAKNMHCKLLELPTNTNTGIELEALQDAIKKKKINLLLLMGNYSNPFASCMPDEHKKEIVRLAQKYNLPVIEDDIYSDLHYSQSYPTFCKSFDEEGVIMWCGSTSKKLAGGYRVGWLEAGKFKEKIIKTKPYHPVNCCTITHEAVAHFFANNKYDLYLKKIRHELKLNSLHLKNAIASYFPEKIKLTDPQGGFLMWLAFDKKVNTMELYNKAIEHKIIISPGRTYTAQNQYNNCISIRYGMPWSDKIENSIKVLAGLVKASY